MQGACWAQRTLCTQRPTRHADPDAPAAAGPPGRGLTDQRPRQSGLEGPAPGLGTGCASPESGWPGCPYTAQSPSGGDDGEGAASEGVCAGCRGAVGGAGTRVWDNIRGASGSQRAA